MRTKEGIECRDRDTPTEECIANLSSGGEEQTFTSLYGRAHNMYVRARCALGSLSMGFNKKREEHDRETEMIKYRCLQDWRDHWPDGNDERIILFQ